MARGTSTVDDMAGEDTVDDVVDDVVDSTNDPEPLPTFEQAFARAKEQHSKPATAGDEPALADDEVSTHEGEDGQPLTRTGKAAPASGKAADDKTKDQTGLISDDEFASLQTTHKDDPAAFRKALEDAFAKSTQTRTDERRSSERLAQYADIIDAYEADAEGTVRELAKQLGLTITAPGDSTVTTEKTDATVDVVAAEFRKALGPDFEYLADNLMPAVKGLVERLTDSRVETATKPIKDNLKVVLDKTAQEQTALVMKALTDQHPDWEEHEPAMLALSQKLSPNGMTETEYLDHLYTLVTTPTKAAATEKDIEAKVAARVKKAIERLNKGAEETETRADATPDRHVRDKAPEKPTIQEAFEAAKRGVVWN